VPLDGTMIREHTVGREHLPAVQQVIVSPENDATGSHAHDALLGAQPGDTLAIGEDAGMRT
jgi:hypothetical protein